MLWNAFECVLNVQMKILECFVFLSLKYESHRGCENFSNVLLTQETHQESLEF